MSRPSITSPHNLPALQPGKGPACGGFTPPPVYKKLTSYFLTPPALFAKKTGGRHQTLRATHPRMLAREAFCHGLQQNPNHQLYEKNKSFKLKALSAEGLRQKGYILFPSFLLFPIGLYAQQKQGNVLRPSSKGMGAPHGDWKGAGGQMSGGWGIGARPLSDGTAPIGRNPLWAAELVGMYFARQRQNMTLYKGNNTGNDVSEELASHYSSINSVGLYPFCPTDAVMPPGSGLPQKRNMDNHSHILTANHLEKLDKDTEITLNVAYHHDRIRREGTSEANYFLSEGQRLLGSGTLTSLTSAATCATAEMRRTASRPMSYSLMAGGTVMAYRAGCLRASRECPQQTTATIV